MFDNGSVALSARQEGGPGDGRGCRLHDACFSWPPFYGIAVLVPQDFVELGLPALMERPEHYYGFIGVALAWQFVFLIVASDVMRYRPLMLAGVLDKLSSGGGGDSVFGGSRIDRCTMPGPSIWSSVHCLSRPSLRQGLLGAQYHFRGNCGVVGYDVSRPSRIDSLQSCRWPFTGPARQALSFSMIGMDPARKSNTDKISARNLGTTWEQYRPNTG